MKEKFKRTCPGFSIIVFLFEVNKINKKTIVYRGGAGRWYTSF